MSTCAARAPISSRRRRSGGRDVASGRRQGLSPECGRWAATRSRRRAGAAEGRTDSPRLTLASTARASRNTRPSAPPRRSRPSARLPRAARESLRSRALEVRLTLAGAGPRVLFVRSRARVARAFAAAGAHRAASQRRARARAPRAECTHECPPLGQLRYLHAGSCMHVDYDHQPGPHSHCPGMHVLYDHHPDGPRTGLPRPRRRRRPMPHAGGRGVGWRSREGRTLNPGH